MKRITLFLLVHFSMHFAYGQAKSFSWSESVEGEWQGEKVRANIDYKVVFWGAYMHRSVCDFTTYWKCYPQYTLFELNHGIFKEIKVEQMLNEKGSIILDQILANVKKDYKRLANDSSARDCLYGIEEPKEINWNNVRLSFKEEGPCFEYSFGMVDACLAIDICETNYSWNDIIPFLKNPNPSTLSFCTPSGPKVNVRAEESAKSEVLFQLDLGEFFEILSIGKQDKVNGKTGSWFKINFEGKTGYIFNFYTLCKEK